MARKKTGLGHRPTKLDSGEAAGTPWRSLVSIVAAVLILTFPPLRATVKTAGQAGERLVFEVASIKQNLDTTTTPHFDWQPGGRVAITAEPLFQLIRFAYNSNSIQTEAQIVGGPRWLTSDRFDVIAKANGSLDGDETGRPIRLLAMLRSLLEDRFHLRVHTERRDAPVFLLVRQGQRRPLGPQLHPTRQQDCRGPVGTLVPPDSSRWCGLRGRVGHYTIQGLTMADIAWVLSTSSSVGRPVLDRTGLSGRWDAEIEFVPAFIAGPNGDSAPVANPNADSGPSVFSAVQDQLGLTLEAAKANVEHLVIDHVDKPAPE